jgi:hypothetical protein
MPDFFSRFQLLQHPALMSLSLLPQSGTGFDAKKVTKEKSSQARSLRAA